MTDAARLGSTLPSDQNIILLTNGIMAASKRETTPEGIERDMAVSYLSRLVALKHLVPRLNPKLEPRIFSMGFPGAGQAGVLGDLNAEKKYSAWEVHMNTVAGNEALVLHYADALRARGVGVYGLNPGLIRTGIRANYLGTGFLSKMIEPLIGLFSTTPERYAETIVPLLFAPELSAHTGAHFNQKGGAILPTPALSADPSRVQALLKESEDIVRARSPTALP